MTDTYRPSRECRECRRVLHESSLRHATALLKSVSSSDETSLLICIARWSPVISFLSAMPPLNTSTVQILRLHRAPNNYRYPLPSSTTTPKRHLVGVSLICYTTTGVRSRRAGGWRREKRCKLSTPNDASNGTRTRDRWWIGQPPLHHDSKIPCGVWCERVLRGPCHPPVKKKAPGFADVLLELRDEDYTNNTSSHLLFPKLSLPDSSR
jgi:hypothetical protein